MATFALSHRSVVLAHDAARDAAASLAPSCAAGRWLGTNAQREERSPRLAAMVPDAAISANGGGAEFTYATGFGTATLNPFAVLRSVTHRCSIHFPLTGPTLTGLGPLVASVSLEDRERRHCTDSLAGRQGKEISLRLIAIQSRMEGVMGQSPNLFQLAEDAVGDVEDQIDVAMADNVITLDEARLIRRLARVAQRRTHDANGAVRAGISMIRTGRVNVNVMRQFGHDDDPDDDGAPMLKAA